MYGRRSEIAQHTTKIARRYIPRGYSKTGYYSSTKLLLKNTPCANCNFFEFRGFEMVWEAFLNDLKNLQWNIYLNPLISFSQLLKNVLFASTNRIQDLLKFSSDERFLFLDFLKIGKPLSNSVIHKFLNTLGHSAKLRKVKSIEKVNLWELARTTFSAWTVI